MKRLIILLISIVIFGCTNHSSELLKNGLTKKASKITEYFVNVKNQNNESSVDTLAIIEKYYNDSDQITKRIQNNVFDDSKIEIEYEHNSFGEIKKEIVTILRDSTTLVVDYLYKDSLLVKTFAESKDDVFSFKQIGEYNYDSNGSLVGGSTSQIYIDLERQDTTLNSVQIDKYDKNELVTESKTINYLNSIANSSSTAEYENRLIISTKNYDSEDSLVSTANYKYEFDKYDNWIKREAFENEILKSIRTRDIDYK